MPRERSAGAVIVREAQGGYLYLLLHYPSTRTKAKRAYWDLPKGHMERGETELETARREVEEETGITKLKFVPGLREEIRYTFQVGEQKIFKTVVFFLASTPQKDIRISHEHLGAEWVPFEQALKQLTFQNAKRVVSKAHEFLEEKTPRGE